MKNKKQKRSERNTRILGNAKIYARNSLQERNSGSWDVRRVRKIIISSIAYSSSLTYYNTTDKIKENNLEIKSIFSIITKNLENAFNFIQKADYFQGD